MNLSSKSSTASLAEVIKEVSNFKHEYLEMVVPCLSKGVMTELRLGDFKDVFKVILFYPNDFNGLIKDEILDLNQKQPQFKKHQCQTFVCSTDSVHVHLAWQNFDEPENEEHLGMVPDFPILGDKTHRFCRSLNVLDESNGTAMHALYIINPEGDLVYQEFLDMTARFDFESVLQILQTTSFSNQGGAKNSTSQDPNILPSRLPFADETEVEAHQELENVVVPKVEQPSEKASVNQFMEAVTKDTLDAAPSRTSMAVLQPLDNKPKVAADTKTEDISVKDTKNTMNRKKKKPCTIL
ncbi:hypothetical protein TCAL_08159 [Tigriopus californicus]|uniref:thioredoxin-dependent peroxiredoxin n=1 Tax=Tigriopus californicus TaxID=6832 RepID=A0A553P270_TIGCA|nr:thioredoxin peroxidase-like [Tigriopus californicus]TRY71740.1 hypothetical protein TCAL_08159 [Tigriopus californicus]|eukprot:TCALIF_08159-PA protein Name:"Similar to Jafrac1 Peroxiredoxin 1 (Drosophila melanogaster)" AED:0.21 eAED:0.21 QI:118/1/1/1/1/1/2/5/295